MLYYDPPPEPRIIRPEDQVFPGYNRQLSTWLSISTALQEYDLDPADLSAWIKDRLLELKRVPGHPRLIRRTSLEARIRQQERSR